MTSYLVFDTETTGLTIDGAPPTDERQPYLLQLGAVLVSGEELAPEIEINCILRHDGLIVPSGAAKIHGIDTARMNKEGEPPLAVLKEFDALVQRADRVCAFNLAFDEVVMLTAYHRVGGTGGRFKAAKKGCLMQSSRDVVGIRKTDGNLKMPRLSEAYKKLVDPTIFEHAHTALADAKAATAVLRALLKLEQEIFYERPGYINLNGALSKARSDTRLDEMADLDAILSLAQDHDHLLSAWEQSFINDFTEKRERYKERTHVSEKQWAVLERIRTKIEDVAP